MKHNSDFLAFALLLPSVWAFRTTQLTKRFPGAKRKAIRVPSTTVPEETTMQGSGSPTNDLPQVIQGVHLPKDEPLPLHVLEEITGISDSLREYRRLAQANFLLIGKPKDSSSNSLQSACDVVARVEGLSCTVPKPDTYQFFGSSDSDHVKELTLLLQSNPFMAGALTPSPDGGFELKSFDPNEKDPSRYLQIIRTLTNGVGHRVNFKFSPTMEFESFTLYDDLEGSPIPTDDAQKYAGAAIFNLLFYASCIHATVHALHFLLVSALEAISRDDNNKPLSLFANDMDDLIARKYVQVAKILIRDPPPPTEPLDLAIITGKDGFGSSQAVRPILKDMINAWGSAPTEYLSTMMNLTEEQMDKGNILTEFRKHHALVDEYASAVVKAFQEIDSAKLSESESKLEAYLKKCGDFTSNVKGLYDWVHLMSVTGMVHGATLSYTRFIGMAHVARWRNALSNVWDSADVNLVSSGLGTITGVEEGRYVMTKSLAQHYPEPLREVMIKFDAESSFLKAEYEEKLLDDPDFPKYGFILSDYCTDTFDGKQMTLSTYI